MGTETQRESQERRGGAEFASLRVDPMAGTEEKGGGRKEEEEGRKEEEEKKKKNNREKKKKTLSPLTRPTLTLPPRTSPFGFLTDVSPGPMTLVSNLFPENGDSACPSFSELLIGAMTSPVAAAGIGRRTTAAAGGENSNDNNNSGGGGSEDKESGRSELPSPFFQIPSGILDSPNFFSPVQGPYGISHQQVLAQVTAQASWSNSHANVQGNYPPISSATTTSMIHPSSSAASTFQQMPTQTPESRPADVPQADTKSQSTSFIVDKPADDGFNWRKYGQKQVKGSEFPRSYYRCTHPDCLVKKKVERSLDGQVTEIIYKGQHNHDQPAPGKRVKETIPIESNGISDPNGKSQSRNLIRTADSHKRDRESGQTAIEQFSGSSDEEVGANDRDEDVHDPKKRNLDAGVTKSSTLHKTVTEPRVIVQTQSEVDLLDDGYRWRKYGQKVVKGNPNPRSYYKCTYTGCTVRKHVERASTDAGSVITTYEGKHNHDVPAARKSSHSVTNFGAAFNDIQPEAYNPVNNHTLQGRTEYSNDQHPAGVFRLKEEGT